MVIFRGSGFDYYQFRVRIGLGEMAIITVSLTRQLDCSLATKTRSFRSFCLFLVIAGLFNYTSSSICAFCLLPCLVGASGKASGLETEVACIWWFEPRCGSTIQN